MPEFRKKPVVIEARQFEPPPLGNGITVAQWCGGTFWFPSDLNPSGSITIPTLEGEMRADPGDWIIRGVQGEFYPCKPDIFAATYEPVAGRGAADGGDTR